MEIFIPILESWDSNDPKECYYQVVANCACHEKERALNFLREESENEPDAWIFDPDPIVDTNGELVYYAHKTKDKWLYLRVVTLVPN